MSSLVPRSSNFQTGLGTRLAHEKSGPGTFYDIALNTYVVTDDIDGAKVQQCLGLLYALTSALTTIS